LDRARAIAAEHRQLSAANAQSYDVAVAKKIGELSPISNAIKEWEDAQNVGRGLNLLLLAFGMAANSAFHAVAERVGNPSE